MERGLLGDKYEPVKRIGHGSYGSVYLARQQQGGSGYVVLKRVFVVEEGAKEHREAINEVPPARSRRCARRWPGHAARARAVRVRMAA